MNNVLVPCKLCGSPAKIIKIEQNDPPCHYYDWLIYCTNCSCKFTYPADNYYGRDYITKEQAIQNWNKLHSYT